MNVLKPNLRILVQTLLDAGKSQREIERVLGEDRKTIRRTHQQSKIPQLAHGLRGLRSAPYVDRECQVALRLDAMSIYQDLRKKFGFTHPYTSVKRFVARLKAGEPKRFDVLDTSGRIMESFPLFALD